MHRFKIVYKDGRPDVFINGEDALFEHYRNVNLQWAYHLLIWAVDPPPGSKCEMCSEIIYSIQ